MHRRIVALLCACSLMGVPARAEAPSRTEFIAQVLTVASEELGAEERRSGYTKYSEWAGSNKYGEWCTEFLSWCVNEADGRMQTENLETLYPMQTSCKEGAEWFAQRGRYVTVKGNLKGYGAQWHRVSGVPVADQPYLPEAGDIIYFEWYKYNRLDHAGIVEAVTQDGQGAYTIHTIEGNRTEAVERFSYAVDDESIRGYGVTRDVVGTELRAGNKGPAVQALQEALLALGHFEGEIDGDFGGRTQRALEAAQQALGLPVTGVADQATQAALGMFVEG